jgi:hypothetical protein
MRFAATLCTVRHAPAGAAVLLVGLAAALANAQLSADQFAELQQQGAAAGWTFHLGANDATARPLDELCGLVVPPELPDAPLDAPGTPPLRSLPAAFDWRDQTGCPPVRNQLACGSCWAFATVGVLECNILIHDNQTVDLSEQWLVSCNRSGYSCGGGWFAHQYFLSTGDACGDYGAVAEADFPYVGSNAACSCPYDHSYLIDSWGYVAGGGTPSVAALKQAIYDYGPVSVAVYANAAFQAYDSGVFNADAPGTVNHGVVLVGWDDNQGAGGVWILRNSWGTGWGEAGYMRIEYGCSSVGYGACYAIYSGDTLNGIEVTPRELDFGYVTVGESATQTVTIRNTGSDQLSGSASGLNAPFSIVGASTYSLGVGASQDLTIRFAPTASGDFDAQLTCSGHGGATVEISGSGFGGGSASDACADAPLIGDGTYAASNVGHGADDDASCCASDAADVWWEFAPPYDGTVNIDTTGSAFDTVLSVYDACGGSELACNDNAVAVTTSLLSLEVDADSTYLVRVAGKGGATGDIVLHVATESDLVVSGRVVDANGDPVSGVLLDGLPGAPFTDIKGYYTAPVTAGFSGAVTPGRIGLSFDPPTRRYNQLASSQLYQDYVAGVASVSISGRIVDIDGRPLPNVPINGFSADVRTDNDGYYVAEVDYGFTGSVAPQKSGYTFSPGGATYGYVVNDVGAQDYVARRQTGAVQVFLVPNDALAAGAAWQINGGPWQASGRTVGGLAVGTHMVNYTPLAGWVPPEADVVSVSPNQTTVRSRIYVPDTQRLVITIEPAGGGDVVTNPTAGPSDTYPADEPVRLTARAASGYRFDGWTGVDDASGADATVIMDSDRSITATFRRVTVAGASDTSTIDGVTAAPLLCGGGFLVAVPGTLLGLLGMRRRWNSA